MTIAPGTRLNKIPINGGQAMPVTDFPVQYPTISPDGTTIAGWCAIPGSPSPACLLDAASGRLLRPLVGAPQRPDLFSSYHFSPDGRTIYYNANAFLIAVDLATGNSRVVLKYEPPEAPPRFAVDSDGTLFVAHGPYTRDAYEIVGFD